jgi:hypothetical protein
MSRIKKVAMCHTTPLVRWWLMVALEEGGNVLFDATRAPALSLERQLSLPLNYWTHRHGLAEPQARDGRNETFWTRQLSAADVASVREAIDTVFDNLVEQFDLSHRTSASRVFSREARSLPPNRLVEATHFG